MSFWYAFLEPHEATSTQVDRGVRLPDGNQITHVYFSTTTRPAAPSIEELEVSLGVDRYPHQWACMAGATMADFAFMAPRQIAS